MKNTILLKGAGEDPNSFWLPYVKRELEKKEYKVSIPLLPTSDDPDIKVDLPFVLKKEKFTKDTVIIAHSSGCPLALAILQLIKVKI